MHGRDFRFTFQETTDGGEAHRIAFDCVSQRLTGAGETPLFDDAPCFTFEVSGAYLGVLSDVLLAAVGLQKPLCDACRVIGLQHGATRSDDRQSREHRLVNERDNLARGAREGLRFILILHINDHTQTLPAFAPMSTFIIASRVDSFSQCPVLTIPGT